MQAKASTQLEQRAQVEQQRAEESRAQLAQLQDRLQEAEASHSQTLQALGALAPALDYVSLLCRAVTFQGASWVGACHMEATCYTHLSLCTVS